MKKYSCLINVSLCLLYKPLQVTEIFSPILELIIVAETFRMHPKLECLMESKAEKLCKVFRYLQKLGTKLTCCFTGVFDNQDRQQIVVL